MYHVPGSYSMRQFLFSVRVPWLLQHLSSTLKCENDSAMEFAELKEAGGGQFSSNVWQRCVCIVV